MTPNEYQTKAARTICDQYAAAVRLEDTTMVQLNHSLIGILGEGGELACLFQKLIYYGKQMPKEELVAKLKDEFGDLLWYVAEGLSAVGLTMEEVMQANIAKLSVRYPDKYSDHLAAEENRNREREAQVQKIQQEYEKYKNEPDHRKTVTTPPRFIARSEMVPVVKEVARTREEVCSSCNGKGKIPIQPVNDRDHWQMEQLSYNTCRQCLGTGKVTVCTENYHDGLEGVK